MINALVDLVLPRRCAGCQARGAALCEACRRLLSGRPLGATRPDPCPEGLPEVVAFAPYDGVVKALLLHHKERGRLDLTAPLGRALGAAAVLLARGPVLVCPVPSARSAVRSRGYDHARRLAVSAARSLREAGIEAQADRLLAVARTTRDQSGLTSAQRAANLHGALATRRPARGGPPVLLVDDVVTTGATLVEAARALRASGHHVAGAAVVAATQRYRSGASPAIPLHRAAVRG